MKLIFSTLSKINTSSLLILAIILHHKKYTHLQLSHPKNLTNQDLPHHHLFQPSSFTSQNQNHHVPPLAIISVHRKTKPTVMPMMLEKAAIKLLAMPTLVSTKSMQKI